MQPIRAHEKSRDGCIILEKAFSHGLTRINQKLIMQKRGTLKVDPMRDPTP